MAFSLDNKYGHTFDGIKGKAIGVFFDVDGVERVIFLEPQEDGVCQEFYTPRIGKVENLPAPMEKKTLYVRVHRGLGMVGSVLYYTEAAATENLCSGWAVAAIELTVPE